MEILTPWSSQVHHEAQPKGVQARVSKKHSKLSYFLLILSKNKENVTFTWAVEVQDVLFLTITGDKFVIYGNRSAWNIMEFVLYSLSDIDIEESY
jgi:hypothetical protein